MATTFSSLLSRLYSRLNLTTVSAAETAVCTEALNAALSQAATAGASQLRETFSGVIPARLSASVTAHSAGSADVTLDSVALVYPGDILQTSTEDYLIRSVNSATKVVNLGIPVAASINGASVTVVRRSFALPTAGQVIDVREVDGRNDIRFDPMAPTRFFEHEGAAAAYTQGYAANLGVSFVNLWPAPAAGAHFVIIQNIAYTEDSDVDMSEPLISYILAEALKYRWAMGVQTGYAGAAAMSDTLRPLLTRAAGGSGVAVRG